MKRRRPPSPRHTSASGTNKSACDNPHHKPNRLRFFLPREPSEPARRGRGLRRVPHESEAPVAPPSEPGLSEAGGSSPPRGFRGGPSGVSVLHRTVRSVDLAPPSPVGRPLGPTAGRARPPRGPPAPRGRAPLTPSYRKNRAGSCTRSSSGTSTKSRSPSLGCGSRSLSPPWVSPSIHSRSQSITRGPLGRALGVRLRPRRFSIFMSSSSSTSGASSVRISITALAKASCRCT